MKKIVFRVDSSNEIGTGHVMRCLTLAERIKDECDITFICRNLDGNIGKIIKNKEFKLVYLPGAPACEDLKGYENWIKTTQKNDALQTLEKIKDKVDCLIIDNYAIDIEWENLIRPCTKKIMVIDDLANRKHSCDILLDQNYNSFLETRYDKLVNPGCKLFLGPKYALLREEFLLAHKNPEEKNTERKRILIFFGGIDKSNETLKTLESVKDFGDKIIVDVVVGMNNPHNAKIKAFCKKYPNIDFHCQINNMAELMNNADICVGAGGAAALERCFMRLPSIVISVAENQVAGSKALSEIGCIDYLGTNDNVDSHRIKTVIDGYLENACQLGKMSKSCEMLFAGYHSAYNELKEAILI